MDAGTEHQRLKLVQRRPSTQHSLLTPSGHFRVHYDTAGSDAVDLADDDANGIPDYIDLAATVLDSIWVLEVEQLGYNPPPSDNGLGGGDEYDVYVVELGGRVYGWAYPGIPSATTTYSHLEIDNNFTNLDYEQTRGLDALRVTIAHEVPPRHSVWLLREGRRLLVAGIDLDLDGGSGLSAHRRLSPVLNPLPR